MDTAGVPLGENQQSQISSASYAPVVVFTYNRPHHTQHTLDALSRNDLAAETDLIVFSDGPRDPSSIAAVAQVRECLANASGFKSRTIVERDSNLGLATSIIEGVEQVCSRFGRLIVVEDDLETSPYFLRYMNDALSLYANDPEVGSIHGYWYPVIGTAPSTFFLRGASCWGWATWSRAWSEFVRDGRALLSTLQQRDLSRAFDLEGAIPYTRMLQEQITGRNDSWAIRWHASMFLAGRLQLWPGNSLVRNFGFDGTGVHCTSSQAYETTLARQPVTVRRIPLMEDPAARRMLVRYHSRSRGSLTRRVAGRLRRALGL